MADSQKMASGAKSGGQRIDDHSFWAGGKGKSSVFPDGPYRIKDESSAEGDGYLMDYQDSTEAIKRTQMEDVKKMKEHRMKQPGYRN